MKYEEREEKYDSGFWNFENIWSGKWKNCPNLFAYMVLPIQKISHFMIQNSTISTPNFKI